ncbi:MAG: glycosyltransferase family 4 protein [Puniceicoccales bacterium]|jgi:glycosyltransferase involved in cell wall biosynthesis|nr:glycosyltransferase family 4 protein [Puniceicoccales bacterium]
MRIAYLFTSFPVASETFLQREIRAMRERSDVEIELWSLWGGKAEWEGMPVRRYPFWSVLRVIFFRVPQWAWRRPGALRRVWAAYMGESSPSLLNIGENLLGLAFALDNADRFRANPPDLFHAVWGTMPAAAAWLLREITGVPFSMGAHAYDIFRSGGDWTLRQKLARACFVHTTTAAARERLLGLGAPPQRTHLIRRGLEILPAADPPPVAALPQTAVSVAPPSAPLRLLSIGRLVPKKGFLSQLRIYRALRDAGVDFAARIVGDGPLAAEIERHIQRLGLAGHVTLAGALSYAQVTAEYAAADIFVFTGVVAEDGDRDGLPNVIPEAMAHGVAVVTTPVSGTTEAVKHGETGQVARIDDVAGWLAAVRRLRDDAAFRQRTRCAARRWVEAEFAAHTNAAKLAAELIAAASAAAKNEGLRAVR